MITPAAKYLSVFMSAETMTDSGFDHSLKNRVKL